MLEVSEKLTVQVAKLARLELSEQEVKVFTIQLREILTYVEKLQEVDVSGIEPLSTPIDQVVSFREDQVLPSPVNSEGKSRVLDSAPEVLAGSFKVPPIL